MPGWRLGINESSEGRWTCRGETRPDKAITVVLTRIVQVDPLELTWIQAARRTFVAEEMNAFLLAWLGGLKCPVINQPSPGCLCGRNWSWQHWAHLANHIGIPVREARRGLGEGMGVTVIGDKAIGCTRERSSDCQNWALQLCAAASQEVAYFHFQTSERGLGLVNAQAGLKYVGEEELSALTSLIKARTQRL